MDTDTMTPDRGPELLTKRSIGGIAVHLVALFTGVFGAGLVYLVSDHPFTRANARNALNWHFSVLLLSFGAFLTFLLGADTMTVGGEMVSWSPLPGPLANIVGVLGTILLFAAGFAWLLTSLFTLVATIKAIFGTPWEYPLAREFIN